MSATPEEKKKRLHKDFDIAMTEEFESEVRDMCNLSRALVDQGIEQGMKQGVEKEKMSLAQMMIEEKEPVDKISKYTGYAIDKLNIADANILNKLSPFFAIIASYFVLKEKANKIEWASVILAFTGAVFVVKPSFHMDFLYAMVGVAGGLGAGVAYTYVRKLGKQGERGPVIVMCFSVFSCIVTLPFIIVDHAPMSWQQTVCLLCAGLAAAGGQFSITAAYQKAPAKEISVFDYSQVIFAAILGFVFLDQIPDALSITGYVIIIGSAVFKWWYSLRQDRKAADGQ